MSSSEEEEIPVPTVPPGYWYCMGTDSDDEPCESLNKEKKKFCSDCSMSRKLSKLFF